LFVFVLVLFLFFRFVLFVLASLLALLRVVCFLVVRAPAADLGAGRRAVFRAAAARVRVLRGVLRAGRAVRLPAAVRGGRGRAERRAGLLLAMVVVSGWVDFEALSTR
jgi:hypothetical protein